MGVEILLYVWSGSKIIGERRRGARRQERDDEREASGSSDRHRGNDDIWDT